MQIYIDDLDDLEDGLTKLSSDSVFDMADAIEKNVKNEDVDGVISALRNIAESKIFG